MCVHPSLFKIDTTTFSRGGHRIIVAINLRLVPKWYVLLSTLKTRLVGNAPPPFLKIDATTFYSGGHRGIVAVLASIIRLVPYVLFF
jgi:hypothetical protein